MIKYFRIKTLMLKGEKGEKGDPGEKGEPGDVTEEYRNLASQIAHNAYDAQTSATNAETSASNAQKAFNDTKEFANQTKTELNQIKTDTNTLKDEAKTSAVNAKASESKAKEYADNLQASTDDISKLKEDLYNKITKLYASNQGETHITDSDNGKIKDMILYGKSLQDGTPTPESPVEIQSVVNPKISISNNDGSLVQEATLPYTLNAIPVSSGGNVTIDGQQYIADYVDIENKKLVRNVRKMILTSLSSLPSKVQGRNGEYHYSFGYNMFDALKKALNIMNSAYVYLMCENTRIVSQSSELAHNENVMSAYGHKDNFEIRVRPLVDDYPTLEELNEYLTSTVVIYPIEPTITDLTDEEVQAFKELATYYPTTNISVNSEQLDGYAVFNYPISLANGWNYVKQQLNDNRDYIYDMDLQSAEAYVNSEYAVTLTELEV